MSLQDLSLCSSAFDVHRVIPGSQLVVQVNQNMAAGHKCEYIGSESLLVEVKCAQSQTSSISKLISTFNPKSIKITLFQRC